MPEIIKGEIIDMIVQKGLEQKLRHFTSGSIDGESVIVPHMLWLGLHCKETWYVESITAKVLGETIGRKIVEKEEVKKPKSKSKAKGKTPK